LDKIFSTYILDFGRDRQLLLNVFLILAVRSVDLHCPVLIVYELLLIDLNSILKIRFDVFAPLNLRPYQHQNRPEKRLITRFSITRKFNDFSSVIFGQKSKFFYKNRNFSQKEIFCQNQTFVKTRNFCQKSKLFFSKSKFLSKIKTFRKNKFFVKNPIVCQKSNWTFVLSKMQFFVKNQFFCLNSTFFVQNQIFCLNSIFLSKIEIFKQNLMFCPTKFM